MQHRRPIAREQRRHLKRCNSGAPSRAGSARAEIRKLALPRPRKRRRDILGLPLRRSTQLVFILAVISGGGTGSGAAPLVAKLARERGALVLACVTLPFSFEGRRRREQAAESLRAIQTYADAVICFENDRMGEVVLPTAGVHDAFGRTDQVLGQCVRSVIDLVQRRGLIRLGFDDLLTALRNHDSRCLFGYGEAAGHDRAALAVDEALRSPLMDGGLLLPRVAHVLVNITGGGDLALAEIQGLMQSVASSDRRQRAGTLWGHGRLRITTAALA